MAGNFVELTDTTFDEEVGASELPLIVDFWATWCGPCKMIAPVLEELAGEKAGELTVAKLDVDANPETARNFTGSSAAPRRIRRVRSC